MRRRGKVYPVRLRTMHKPEGITSRSWRRDWYISKTAINKLLDRLNKMVGSI